jgi:hypothetical protein
MTAVAALRAAIDLFHNPSQAALLRTHALPEGVLGLLRIAAGDEETVRGFSIASGRSPEKVREAAIFFLEQILLHPDADSYRVLGADRDATYAVLRQNMSLLLQWLHPDVDHGDMRSVFAGRVTSAWNDLKTRERRAAYDRRLRRVVAEKTSQRPTHAPFHKGLISGHSRGRSQRLRPRLPQARRNVGLLRKLLFLLFGRSISWK